MRRPCPEIEQEDAAQFVASTVNDVELVAHDLDAALGQHCAELFNRRFVVGREVKGGARQPSLPDRVDVFLAPMRRVAIPALARTLLMRPCQYRSPSP